MALVLYDRVQQTGTANTTASFTLSGSVTGYQSFAVVGNGNTTYYGAVDASGNWEAGVGTYSTTGPTLTRTTILASSNSGSAVSTFSGSVNIFVTYPAEKSVNQDANGNVNISYTPNVATNIGVLNVGDGTYSASATGQLASFASADATYANVILQNTNNTSSSAYSSYVTAANNYPNQYMEIGSNSTNYNATAAGFVMNSLNAAGANFVQSYGSDLTLATWTNNNIHFLQNATSATTDSMTLYADGGASLGGLGSPGIGNIAINNAVVGLTTTTASAGTLVLTSASTQVQVITGATTQSIQLPQATTLLKGTFYTVANNSTGNVTVKDNAGTTLETLTTGGAAQFLCVANGTSAGTWGVRVFASSNTQWGNTALNYSGNITGATWQGNTIGTGYGGTGLTTFSSSNYALYSTSPSTLVAGTLPVLAGGTGLSNTPTAGQILIGNGTNYSLSTLTAGTAISITNGSGTITVANNGVTAFSGGSTGLTPSSFTAGAVTLSGTLAIANGGTGQTSASAAFNALSPITTTGDLIIGTGVNTSSRLGIGSSGYVLQSNGSTAAWVSPPGSSILTTTDFTATSGQTTFSVTYTPSLLQGVYRNGIKLGLSDYTATNGTSIVLNTGAITGDLIEVQYFSALATTTTVTSFSGGSTGLTPSSATSGAVTLAGTLAVGNGGTGVTSSTGSGSNVLNTSPTLVTPILGTPASGTLTNCTGYTTANLSGTISNAQLANSSVTVTAGTGMSGGGAVALGSSVTLTNAGVTSIVAGTGISVSGATGAVTVSSTSTGAAITPTTTSGTYYVVGTTSTSGSLSTASISTTSPVSYNASTGALTASSFSGAGTNLTGTASGLSIGGNAATATTATTANALNTANSYTVSGLTVNNSSAPYITFTGGPLSRTATFGMTDGYNMYLNACSGGNLYIGAAIFNGAITSSYAISASSFVASSDERLKTDWQDLPVDFVSNLADVKHGTFERIKDGTRDVGVTAQSLQPLLPEAVIENEDGYLAVNYGGAALVAAIELAKEVKELRAEIKALKAELNK
jgi:hypothetical protein